MLIVQVPVMIWMTAFLISKNILNPMNSRRCVPWTKRHIDVRNGDMIRLSVLVMLLLFSQLLLVCFCSFTTFDFVPLTDLPFKMQEPGFMQVHRTKVLKRKATAKRHETKRQRAANGPAEGSRQSARLDKKKDTKPLSEPKASEGSVSIFQTLFFC